MSSLATIDFCSSIDGIDKAHEGFAAPTSYLQLDPDNREYFNKDFSIGIHTYYTEGNANREKLLKDGTHRRWSNGCINTPNKEAWSIYDKLEVGSHVFITNEP